MCKINGKKLAEIRKENGMTQKQFAEALGVSKSAIQNYEKAQFPIMKQVEVIRRKRK